MPYRTHEKDPDQDRDVQLAVHQVELIDKQNVSQSQDVCVLK